MKTVTAHMKLRSLISHGGLVWSGGQWIPLSQFRYPGKTSAVNYLNAARRAGLTVQCACGCGVWVTYGEIQFDHAVARVNGGSTEIRWIQPLRYDCHKAKSRLDLKWRDKLRRIAAKFGRGASEAAAPRSNRWPSKGSRPLGGRPWQLYAVNGGRV